MFVTASTRKRLVAILAAAALAAGALATTTPAAAGPTASRHAYPGAVPSLVGRTAAISTAAADTTVEGEIFLVLRHSAAAAALAGAVSTPGNASYGKYLTPQQWITQFAPTAADFQLVKTYLVHSGLTISGTPASRLFIVFRGPASTINPTFATSINTYRYQGRLVTAPASAPSLPAAIASKVSGVSLGNSGAKVASNVKRAVDAQSSAAPKGLSAASAAKLQCSNYWAQYRYTLPKAYGRTSFPTVICGYLPRQLRSSASLTAGENGAGQTVAIVDAYASPTIVSDTNRYMKKVGSPPLTTFSEIKPAAFSDEATCGYPSGWQPEETLDVQSAHSIAPAAKILYVGGFNCNGGIDIALSKILDGGLATIVSNSYGAGPEELVPLATIRGEENQQLQAVAEGIGLYYSTGDSGDNQATLGLAGPDWLATSPWVTSVGGTSLAIGPAGRALFQTGWGGALDQVVNGKYVDPLPGALFGGGGGGGTSVVFTQPAYQHGIVPAALAEAPDGTLLRVVPDVADLADPYTGFQIAISPIVDDGTLKTGPLEYDTYGGTSLASPIVAAKIAILQQKLGRTVGFANPLLYAARRSSALSFHDVVTPKHKVAVAYISQRTGHTFLVTFNQDTSLTTRGGFDNVTGLGTLNMTTLLSLLK